MDKINTELDLDYYETTYRNHFYDFVVTRIMNRDPSNLEAALLQAVVQNDTEEPARIKGKLIKPRKLGLQLVSDKSD